MSAMEWVRALIALSIPFNCAFLGAYLTATHKNRQIGSLREQIESLRQREMASTHTSIDLRDFLARRAKSMKRASRAP